MSEKVVVILAYVDPGSAGFIIVSVLGFLAAAGYTARAYISRLKGMVFRSGQDAGGNRGQGQVESRPGRRGRGSGEKPQR